MYTLLLSVIYLAFISLGLPDSLLGAAWPSMQPQLGVPVAWAGILSMLISAGTIVSSLLSHRLTKKLGAGPVTALSVLATAVALFGFSVSGSFWVLCLWAIPYGLGAGAVDAALNNYVALHYASRHMNWLHCFWGVGAAVGPVIMARCLATPSGWGGGYRVISLIQIILAALLFASLPLWKRQNAPDPGPSPAGPALGLGSILCIKGVRHILLAFFGYSALEMTAGLWASSYLVATRGLGAGTAARYASLFYLGITLGRFISGFFANKLGDRNMIRIGVGILFVGILAVGLPVHIPWLCLAGLVAVGLGCAPVYPSIIHATPANFGAHRSQAIIGVQMASAYVGSTLMPPLFGFVATHAGIQVYPVFLFACALLLLAMTERLNHLLPHTA